MNIDGVFVDLNLEQLHCTTPFFTHSDTGWLWDQNFEECIGCLPILTRSDKLYWLPSPMSVTETTTASLAPVFSPSCKGAFLNATFIQVKD